MKKILMIREIKEEYFSLPLEDYILTFDGGLYSHFHYRKDLQRIKTEKIFFVTTGNINKGLPSEELARGATMSAGQLLELKSTTYCDIGGNGHSYLDFRENKDNIVNTLMLLRKDTETMQTIFSKELKIRPIRFCYPYNKEIFRYEKMLRKNGYRYFYGNERIDIDSLLEKKEVAG